MNKAIPLLEIVNSPVNKDWGNVSAKTFMEAINGKTSAGPEPAGQQKPDGMAVHIEIKRIATNGDCLVVNADIRNQNDLAAFHETYCGYLPRKKIWGLI
jgi:hypothetical protein